MSTLPEDASTPHVPAENAEPLDADQQLELAPAEASMQDVQARAEMQLERAEPVEPALLFQSWEQPVLPPTARIPNMGQFLLLCAIAGLGLLASIGVLFGALHFHFWGIATRDQAANDIHYTLGSELILYLVSLAIGMAIFPMLWDRPFFKGVQWNGATAYRLRFQLIGIAVLCFLTALMSGLVASGPKDAPIEKILRSPGAPWLLFAFGTTLAPFFEEMFFRGFFLPAMCTACDWVNEKIRNTAPPPLGPNGHPQWSRSAMITGAIFTSLPFAAIHLPQTANSWSTFVLLVVVSMVLCGVRLSTRSLAASVLTHASYNFLLFSVMLVGSGGFKHLENL